METTSATVELEIMPPEVRDAALENQAPAEKLSDVIADLVVGSCRELLALQGGAK